MKKYFNAGLLFILITVSLCFTQGEVVEGLSCAEAKSASEEYERSEYVFKGKVVQKSSTSEGMIARFHMEHIWKGKLVPELDVFEQNMWLEYQQGAEYLVYAKTDDQGRIWAHTCGRTNSWEFANGDTLEFGNEGTAVGSNNEKDTHSSTIWVSLVTLFICLAIVIIIYMCVVIYRRRIRMGK